MAGSFFLLARTAIVLVSVAMTATAAINRPTQVLTSSRREIFMLDRLSFCGMIAPLGDREELIRLNSLSLKVYGRPRFCQQSAVFTNLRRTASTKKGGPVSPPSYAAKIRELIRRPQLTI